MKSLIALLFIATAASLSAQDVPKPFSFGRYQRMLDHSPFAVATAVAVPAATPNFAKDLYVANAAKSPDGDMVTIASSSDRNFKKYLTTKAPEDGYSISKIDWSSRVGETKVTISKDGQFATLTFNQALLTQPLPAQAQQNQDVDQPNNAGQPVPITPSVSNRVMKPAPIPMLPTPPPRIRGMIPRNPNMRVPATPPPTRY